MGRLRHRRRWNAALKLEDLNHDFALHIFLFALPVRKVYVMINRAGIKEFRSASRDVSLCPICNKNASNI